MLTPLGTLVRSLRERMELTQAELAAQSHLGMGFIWEIESDKEVECSPWQLERLAKTLGVTEESLIALAPRRKRRLNGAGGEG